MLGPPGLPAAGPFVTLTKTTSLSLELHNTNIMENNLYAIIYLKTGNEKMTITVIIIFRFL